MANFKIEQILSHQESDIIVCPTLDNAPSVLPETKFLTKNIFEFWQGNKNLQGKSLSESYFSMVFVRSSNSQL